MQLRESAAPHDHDLVQTPGPAAAPPQGGADSRMPDASEMGDGDASAGAGGEEAQAVRLWLNEAGEELRQYEYLDHTADVQFHTWGESLEEAFEQAVDP